MRKAPSLKALTFFLALFIIDRLSKYWVLRNLSYNVKEFFILRFRFVRNTGSLFGIGRDLGGFWLFASLVIFIVLVYFFIKDFKKMEVFSKGCLLLIMLGALSNIIDRAVYGWVIDFIDLRVWPVFNLADAYITSGVTLLAYEIFLRPKKGRHS